MVGTIWAASSCLVGMKINHLNSGSMIGKEKACITVPRKRNKQLWNGRSRYRTLAVRSWYKWQLRRIVPKRWNFCRQPFSILGVLSSTEKRTSTAFIKGIRRCQFWQTSGTIFKPALFSHGYSFRQKGKTYTCLWHFNSHCWKTKNNWFLTGTRKIKLVAVACLVRSMHLRHGQWCLQVWTVSVGVFRRCWSLSWGRLPSSEEKSCPALQMTCVAKHCHNMGACFLGIGK